MQRGARWTRCDPVARRPGHRQIVGAARCGVGETSYFGLGGLCQAHGVRGLKLPLAIVLVGLAIAGTIVADPLGWFEAGPDPLDSSPPSESSSGTPSSGFATPETPPMDTHGVDFQTIDDMSAAISQSGIYCEQFHELQPGESAPDSDAGAVDDPGLVEWGQCFTDGEILTLKIFETPESLSDYLVRAQEQIMQFDPDFYITVLHSEGQSWLLEVNYRPYIVERFTKALDATEETCLGGC